MTRADQRVETKRSVESLLDFILENSSECETPLFSRNEAFELIHAALRGYSVSVDSVLAAYATATIIGSLRLKFWTFDDYEAQVCRRAIRPSSSNDD